MGKTVTFRRCWALAALAGVLLSACTSTPTPSAVPTPTQTFTATFQIIALPSVTPTRTLTLTPTPPEGSSPPGTPGIGLAGALDPLSTTAYPQGTYAGDAYTNNVFERPFSTSGGLPLPDADLAAARISHDERWLYFSIQTAGLRPPTRQLLADYAVELDTDGDGRGDWLLWTAAPLSPAWAAGGVRLYEDRDNDVGAENPLSPDKDSPGGGYEALIFDGSQPGGQETAWARLDPLDPLGIQLAVERDAVGRPEAMLWSAWAGAPLRQPDLFDYHDHLSASAAELQGIDSTCRAAYGFDPSGVEAGVCPPEWRAATPVPTEAPTETLQFSPTPTLTLTPTQTGTPATPTPTGSIKPTGSTTAGPSATPSLTPTVTETLAPGSPSAINGFAWSDSNSNGLRETGEPGLSGFTIRLGSGACPASGLATQISAADGFFSFGGLNAGSYCVSIDHPNRTSTNPDQVTIDLSSSERQVVLFGLAP